MLSKIINSKNNFFFFDARPALCSCIYIIYTYTFQYYLGETVWIRTNWFIYHCSSHVQSPANNILLRNFHLKFCDPQHLCNIHKRSWKQISSLFRKLKLNPLRSHVYSYISHWNLNVFNPPPPYGDKICNLIYSYHWRILDLKDIFNEDTQCFIHRHGMYSWWQGNKGLYQNIFHRNIIMLSIVYF